MDASLPDPNAYSGASLLPSAVAMACLSTAAVLLRFVSRRITRVALLCDDWLILAALPFSLLECAIDIEGNYFNHFGRHIQTGTPDEIRMFFITTYIFQLSYGFAVTLPKFSMLALYKRIFGLDSFRIPLIFTFCVCVAYLIGISFSAIFVCVPVNAFWDRTVPGKCTPLLPFYIGQASVNILLDLILLLLPIIPIRRLNITSSQKIAVIGIFFLGIFVTVCSAIRLHALVVTTSAPAAAMDPTFNFVSAAVWSVVETNLSVVCACLPSMRPLLRAVIHGTFRSSAGRSDYSSHMASNNRASALVRTVSNRIAPSDRPAPPARTWSQRIAAVEHPNIVPQKRASRVTPAERASKWFRANTAISEGGDGSGDGQGEKYSLASLPPVTNNAGGRRPSLTSWRPNCPRARAALDAVLPGPSRSNQAADGEDPDRQSSRSSWRPLHPKARDLPEPPAAADDLPRREDSVTVLTNYTVRGGRDDAIERGIGYRYEIRGGRDESSDSSDMDVKDLEAADAAAAAAESEWERARRKPRGKGRSLGRQVWDDWSRRGSRND